jgi:energy-converting hydrogenase Eha subunit B
VSEFTDFLENELLDHVFANAAYSAPANVHLALYTTTCSDSARGTEVSGGGYGRQSTAFGTASAGTISNSAIESFTASANYGTVVATGLEDASTSGNQLCFDNDFTDTTVNSGDTLQFAIGDIDVSLT